MTVAPPAIDVLRASALELAEAIRERRITSREVVQAHVDRLEAVNPVINAVVVPRFEQALAEADAADARIGDPDLPPLHGVPCTIKECFAFEGLPNSSGLVARRDTLAEADAPAVRRLREAGAIPLGLTNTSELCMWWGDSANHVYGRTANPYSPRRTAGGSSGGEGAAVGSGGSPFGLGSDIGGSIRIPAFFNGVFGHKPSPGTVPNDGQYPIATGYAARMLASGPLARRARDLMPLVRIMADDPSSLGDPESVAIEGMRVLAVESAWLIPVRKDVRVALRRAAEELRAAGAQVDRERFGQFARSFEMLMAGLDGDEAMFSEMLGDGRSPSSRRLLADLVTRRSPHTLPSVVLALTEVGRGPSERRFERLRKQGEHLAEEVAEAIGDGVLLYPTHPRVAPLHRRNLLSPWGCAYAGAFNVMGLPVTQVPLGLNARGIPTGVQVVARPGNDHVSIAVALELERRLGGWVPPR